MDRLEGFVMLWKKGKDIITVASQIIDKVQYQDEDKIGGFGPKWGLVISFEPKIGSAKGQSGISLLKKFFLLLLLF